MNTPAQVAPTSSSARAAPPASGVPRHIYSMRVGPILGLPALVAELGAAPERAFAEAGVPLSVFANAENRISLADLGRLIEACAQVTRCTHIGMLLGQRFRLSALREVGDLLHHSPTLGDACRQLVLHLHVQDRGAVPLLMYPSARHAALGYAVLRHDTAGLRQFHDCVNAMFLCVLRELAGPRFTPTEVWFAHSQPADLAPYRTNFGSRLRFDADVSAVVFAAQWLREPVPGAQPEIYAQLTAQMAQMDAALGLSLAAKVQRSLQSMVFSGTASVDGLAHLFHIHERTLRRHLQSEGTTAHALIQEALFNVARQLLQETQLSISEIATALHYNDAAAFAHAFRRWAGCSPRQWRLGPGSGSGTA